MLRDMLSHKAIQAGLIFVLLVVCGSLLYSWQMERTLQAEAARDAAFRQRLQMQKTSIDTETSGEITPDVMEHKIDAPVASATVLERAFDSMKRPDAEPEVSKPRRTVLTSSNPFFANGVPEHLQCPEELVGRYAKNLSIDEKLKIYQIYQEVVEKYNPNRPLSEVWPQFIEAEIYYHASAEPENAIPGIAAGRTDWGVQTILDYPEIVLLEVEDAERFSDMCMVARGRWDPDWNLHVLPDGREFRTATGYYYEFSYSDAEGLVGRTMGIGHSGRDAQLIKVNLNETLDEELERLSEWNYNINPYTTGIYQ